MPRAKMVSRGDSDAVGVGVATGVRAAITRTSCPAWTVPVVVKGVYPCSLSSMV